jgi:glucose/arabinose dehydrogenase
MMRNLLITMLILCSWTTPLQAFESSQGTLKLTKMAKGLKQPWSIGFLPGGAVLITERGGALWCLSGGKRTKIEGVPKVHAKGEGGLFDVLVPHDFAQTRQLYFSYAKIQPDGAGTALASARLSADNRQLENWTVIFELMPGTNKNRHYGGRIVEAPDGTLFASIGEHGDRPAAQDLSRENGSVIRINRDGSIPADNPFVDTPDARPAIWSYGHRNPEGLTLDLQGNLWLAEHGAKGGDEVNFIRKGANYGWPVISYGVHYSGERIGEGTHKPGMEQPEFYWDPSMAPSGMMIYSGKLWPDWRGNIFVGSLKFDYIARLTGTPLAEVEQLKSKETDRVRDVREAPDGTIWFLSVVQGALYRLSPSDR